VLSRQPNQLRRHFNVKHNPEYVASAPREKPHKCALCYKAFRYRVNLRRHTLSHASEAAASVSADDE